MFVDELKKLNNSGCCLSTETKCLIQSLGINRIENNININKTYKKTHRGVKAGKNRPRNIKTVIGNRNETISDNITTCCNVNNLVNIHLARNCKSGKLVNYAVLNARSVLNKASYIHDFVIENGFDILGFTETWLTEYDERDIISSLTPNGYDFHHKPRANKAGGGVGLLIKSN